MKYAICILLILNFQSAFARNACTDTFTKSNDILNIIQNPQFQEALRMYEEAGFQIANAKTEQQELIANIKQQNSVLASAAELSSDRQARLDLNEDLLTQLKDTILATEEQLKPWRRNLKMSEGLLMYYQGKLEAAGFQVFFMKTGESFVSEDNPDMTEARLFGDTENVKAKYRDLVASPQGRFYVVSPTVNIAETGTSTITATQEVVALTYAESFNEFSGGAIVSSISVVPRLMQVELSTGPEGYVSSQLIARDFREICK
jgi:hypothetical protein